MFPWYLHVAANLYQYRKRNYKIAKAATQTYAGYKTYKMLRGTKRKQTYALLNTRPTLQNQITALKRQVAEQKPETQYFRVANNHVSAAAAVEQANHLVTQSLIADPGFRNFVTGDQWANLWLNLKFTIQPDCKLARILCYVPKKSGQRFNPASFKMTTLPDPSAFWVISDSFVNHIDSNTATAINKKFNLRKLKTLYDSQNTSIERGEIIITVIYEAGTAATRQYDYGWELVYHNV